MPPAKSPGGGLLLARRRRGAKDKPRHLEVAGVPGDCPPAGSGIKGSGAPAGHTSAGMPFFLGRAPF